MNFLLTLIQHSRQPVRRAQNGRQPIRASSTATGLGMAYPAPSAPAFGPGAAAGVGFGPFGETKPVTPQIPGATDALPISQPILQVANTVNSVSGGPGEQQHAIPNPVSSPLSSHGPVMEPASISEQSTIEQPAMARQMRAEVGSISGQQVDLASKQSGTTPLPDEKPAKPEQKPPLVPKSPQTAQQSIQSAQVMSSERPSVLAAKAKDSLQPASSAQQATRLENTSSPSKASQPTIVGYPGDKNGTQQPQPVVQADAFSFADNAMGHQAEPEQPESRPLKPEAIRVSPSPVNTAQYLPPANNGQVQTTEIPQVRINQINVLVEDQSVQQNASAKRVPASAKPVAANPFGLRGL